MITFVNFEGDVGATNELAKFVSDSALKCIVPASHSPLTVVLTIRLEWAALTNPLTVGYHAYFYNFWVRLNTCCGRS